MVLKLIEAEIRIGSVGPIDRRLVEILKINLQANLLDEVQRGL